MSRDPHEPTKENRKLVRYLAGLGQRQDDIAAIIGCSEKTLRLYYRIELDEGLEGISALPDAIAAVVRSSLDDAALIGGLKGRLEDLEIRLERLTDRHEKKRTLARWAMQEAGLEKLSVEDFSVGLRKGTEKLEVLNETSIPANYFVLQPAKLDRKVLLDDLKRGKLVGGARVVTGEPSIQVRVR